MMIDQQLFTDACSSHHSTRHENVLNSYSVSAICKKEHLWYKSENRSIKIHTLKRKKDNLNGYTSSKTVMHLL